MSPGKSNLQNRDYNTFRPPQTDLVVREALNASSHIITSTFINGVSPVKNERPDP